MNEINTETGRNEQYFMVLKTIADMAIKKFLVGIEPGSPTSQITFLRVLLQCLQHKHVKLKSKIVSCEGTVECQH